MSWHVSLAVAVSVVVICITTYQMQVDPRVPAMHMCTKGWHNTDKQLACARELFGGHNAEQR